MIGWLVSTGLSVGCMPLLMVALDATAGTKLSIKQQLLPLKH